MEVGDGMIPAQMQGLDMVRNDVTLEFNGFGAFIACEDSMTL